MRILQLGKFYPIRGGVEKVMYEFMQGLSERGIDCDMMCAMESGPTCEIRLNAHGRLLGCHSLTKRSATMIAPSMIRQLRRVCHDYDIIHIHHPDPMATVALRLSGYKGRVILHWHSDIVRQQLFLKAYKGLQNWLIKRADLIVGTTSKYVEESPHLANGRHKLTALPIGINAMKPDHEGAERIRQTYAGKKIVFSLGRLVTYKGFEHLIDAAALLPDDYVILIGGTGPLRQELEAQIARLGVTHKVKLLGFVTDEELPAYFTACHLFCMPSITKNEAFGIVQIEAMSVGKPVVTTRIPESGVSWVNAHGESGLNVEPGNADELAAAIRQILDDPDELRRYSQGASDRYNRLFTHTKMIDDLLEIYRKMLQQ